jgi:peptidoglycan/LPS O-acetylase OafA/YrhL
MVCIPWQVAFEKIAYRLPGLAEGALPLPIWLIEFAGVVPAAMVVHHLVELPAHEAMRRHGIPFVRERSPARTGVAGLATAGNWSKSCIAA